MPPNFPGLPVGRSPITFRQPASQSQATRDYTNNNLMRQGLNPQSNNNPQNPQSMMNAPQKPAAPPNDPLVRFEQLTPELLARLTGKPQGDKPPEAATSGGDARPATSKAAILQNERNASEFYRIAAETWGGRVFTEMLLRGRARYNETRALFIGVNTVEGTVGLPDSEDEALRFAISQEGATISEIAEFLENDNKSTGLNRLMWRKVADLAFLIAGR